MHSDPSPPAATLVNRALVALLLMLTIALSSAGSIWGDGLATITVTTDNSGSCVIQGSSIVKAAAFEFTLTYDTAILSNPRVQQGPFLAGAFNAVNAQSPGTVRFAAVTTAPFSGAGTLASIAFDIASSRAGRITSFTAKLATLDGKAIPATIRIVNNDQPAAAPETQSETAFPLPTGPGMLTRSTSGGQPIPVGPSTEPAVTRTAPEDPISQSREESRPLREQKPRSTPPQPAQVKSEAATAGGKTRTIYTVQSVLDRFREFRGARTIAAYSALFEQEEAIGLRQEPAIVLTDGKAVVRITFIAPADLKGTPDVALLGAQMVSLARDPDATNMWAAVVLPNRKTWDAKITISFQSMTMAHQLTIAPFVEVDLDRSATLTSEDFNRFQREQGTAKAPLHDLNRDGKRDYIDDYIFMANYLAGKRK